MGVENPGKGPSYERFARGAAGEERDVLPSQQRADCQRRLTLGPTLSDIICECSSRGCVERLELTNGEYEHVRSRGDWFLVAEGHEDPSIEDVVERHAGYIVVEKQGGAKAIAEAEDPR